MYMRLGITAVGNDSLLHPVGSTYPVTAEWRRHDWQLQSEIAQHYHIIFPFARWLLSLIVCS